METVQLRIKAEVPLILMRDGQTRQIVAYSPALDISSCGSTEAKAVHAFVEAANLFVAELVRLKTIDDVFAELGWRKVVRPQTRWIAPQVINERSVPIRIPAHA